MTKWEYHAFTADDIHSFLSALNSFGNEGWEAVSANYTMGEPQRVPITTGGGTIERPGPPQWIAVLKRQRR